MSRTDTEPPARPAAALSCYPKWKRRPWDSPGRMGNRGRCRKTCKVRGEAHGAPPPRTLGFPSAKRPFHPAKKVCGSCLRAVPSPPAPRPAEPLPSRASFQGDSSGHRGAGAPGPTTRPCSEGINGAEEPSSIWSAGAFPEVQTSRRTLPGPAADPGDLGLIAVPRKIASKFMAGGVTRGSSGEHPVCHTPSRNGTRRLCPAGAAPTGTVQVAAAVSRNFPGESSGLCGGFAPLRSTQEGRGMPKLGWRWKCLCGVAEPIYSLCPARSRSGAPREPAQTPPRVGSLPWSRQPGMRALPAPSCATLLGQKLPSRLLFRSDPLSFREPAGK